MAGSHSKSTGSLPLPQTCLGREWRHQCTCLPAGMQGRHWVLDPIDGTRGFVGMRQYAVCLGLLDAAQARPVMQPHP